MRRRALPLLAGIAEATAAASFLVVLHLGSALCVEAVPGERMIAGIWVIGEQRPLNACAGARVLMAYLPLEARMAVLAGPLPALTPATPTDPFQLSSILDTIRRRDWDVGLGDVSEGVASFGLPVRRDGSDVVAALGISGTRDALLEGERPRHLEMMRRRVAELERRLEAPASGARRGG
jgi:DNA-binding IclR family transcriptional regulator